MMPIHERTTSSSDQRTNDACVRLRMYFLRQVQLHPGQGRFRKATPDVRLPTKAAVVSGKLRLAVRMCVYPYLCYHQYDLFVDDI